MRYFLPLLFLFQFSFCKPPMIIGLPRSGSTFFARMVARGLRGDYGFDVANMRKRGIPFIMANGFFGEFSLNFWNKNPYNMFEKLDEELFERLWNQWVESGAHATKEVTAYANIPLYIQKYQIVAIFRRPQFTFPTTRASFFIGIYESFMRARLPDSKLKELQAEIGKMAKLSRNRQMIAGYVVAAYVMLDYCITYNIPIIEYNRYITLSGEALFSYIKERLPESLYSKKFFDLLVKYRYERGGEPEKWLKEREEKYKKAQFKKHIQPFYDSIKKIDPDFKGWHYFT